MNSMLREKQFITDLLRKVDVSVNGKRSWDIQVHNDEFYRRVVTQSTLGLGESYMDGWWDAPALEEFFFRITRADLDRDMPLNRHLLWMVLKYSVTNVQTKIGSRRVAQVHYDLTSDFYMQFLGPYNQYTSLYYKNTNNFEKAEIARLDLICRKLQLKKSDNVLEIGCGWGGFAKYAAQKYGCKITAVTISKEQAAFARKFCKGLPVKILLKDYRDISGGSYTKIFSGGMVEHVGYRNYRTYMKVVHDNLAENGLFLIDCLGQDSSTKYTEPWIEKYIFPHSMVPSVVQFAGATEGLFVMEDWHNFGNDYFKTCMDWFKRFDKNWKKIQKLDKKFDDRFYRMWKYYLLSSAGALRARFIQEWQIVYSKKGIVGGYQSIR